MGQIERLILPLIMTLITECALAFFIGIKGRRRYAVIILMNILTNPLLNTALRLFDLSGARYYIAVFILEAAVVFIEGLLLKKAAGTLPMDPFILSFILNLSSFTAGLIWAFMLFLYMH